MSEEKVSVLVEGVCGCGCVWRSRHSVGLSMCRKRLDYMRVCGELEMFVSVERVVRVWREPTAHRCMHGKLSVLCVKVLRVSRESWRESQACGVCVEGERGLCVCLWVEIRVCVEKETGVVEREPGVYGRRESRMWKERKMCGCFCACYHRVCVWRD